MFNYVIYVITCFVSVGHFLINTKLFCIVEISSNAKLISTCIYVFIVSTFIFIRLKIDLY